MKKLTLLASNFFQYLNVSKQLNIPSNHRHGMAKGKSPCDNCNGEHYSTDFPHTRDKANIKNSKEEHTACRGSGGRGGGRQGGRKKLINDNKYGDRNNYGLKKRGNAWMCYCRCQDYGWNTTHTSGSNAAWKRDNVTFSFPADHAYWNLSGKTDGVETGTVASERGGEGIPPQRRLALPEIISLHQGEDYDAIFSSFLTEFSKVLDNLK